MKSTLDSRNSTPSPKLSLTDENSEGPETTEKKASAAPSMEQHEEQANIINGWRLPQSIGVITAFKGEEVQSNTREHLQSEPQLINATAPLGSQTESLNQTTISSAPAAADELPQHYVLTVDIPAGRPGELNVNFNDRFAELFAVALQADLGFTQLNLVIHYARYDLARHQDLLQRFCYAIASSKVITEVTCDFYASGTLSLAPLARALTINTSIKKLTLSLAREWQVREVLQGLRFNSGINSFELLSTIIEDDKLADPILAVYEANPRLTSFTMRDAGQEMYDSTINRDSAHSVLDGPRKLGSLFLLPKLRPTLEYLDLDIRRYFDEDARHYLTDSFGISKQLRTLKLCLYDLPEDSANALWRALSANPDLKELAIDLHVDFSKKYGAGGGAIKFIGSCPNIRSLTISELKGQGQIDQLAEVLHQCGRIESLSLLFPYMRDNETPIECSKLASLIATKLGLTALSLSVFGARLAGMELVCASIIDSPSIRHLSLRIREDQASAVCDLVTGTNKILCFNLCTRISDQTAMQLARAFEKNFAIVDGQITFNSESKQKTEAPDSNLHSGNRGDTQQDLCADAEEKIYGYIQRNQQLLDAPLAGHGLQAMMELLPTSKPELPALPAELGSQLAAAAVMALNPQDAATVIRALKL